MLLTKPNLIPPALVAANPVPNGIRKDDIADWQKKRFPKNPEPEEQPPPEKPLRCFNWTCTRGDRFAICFAADEFAARRYVLQHAFVHLCEIDKRERKSQGRSLPTRKVSLDAYYARLRVRAMKFSRGCVLRELTRDEFKALCDEQRSANG